LNTISEKLNKIKNDDKSDNTLEGDHIARISYVGVHKTKSNKIAKYLSK